MKSLYPKERYPGFQDFRALVTYASKFGEKTLYRYIVNKDDVRELSYKQFCDNVINLSTALYAFGLKEKKIALIAETCPEWLQTYIAVICAGAVIVPIDKDLLPEQIAEFIDISECEAVFTTPDCRKKLGNALSTCKAKYFFDIDRNSYFPYSGSYEKLAQESTHNFYTLVAYGAHLLSVGYLGIYNITYNVDAPCALIYTSGTTGTSKGVLLSQHNILSCSVCCTNLTPYTPSDVFLSVLPMHHTYETTIQISILTIGSTICLNNSIKYVMRNLKRFQPTAMVVVPLFLQTMYKRINDEVRKKGKEKTFSAAVKITGGLRKVKVDLRRAFFTEVIGALGGRMKNIICGGASLDSELVKRFEELGINVYQGYGITECSPLVSVNPYTKIKYESIGLPVQCCEVKVLKSVDGVEARASTYEHGEIAVRGSNVMLGYYNNPEATKQVFTRDGFFRTGDIGYFDEDGYLYITGRKKNLIILSNGKNVYPEEIEEYLERIECVKDCVVLARNNELGESVITAIIQPDEATLALGDDEAVLAFLKQEVMQHVNNRLPSFKQIRNIEIRKDDFEKTSTQKIKRHKIK